MKKLLLLVVGLSFALSGCFSKDFSKVKEYLPRKLSGEVRGEEFVYRYAYIDPTAETPEEDDYLFVFLPYKPKLRCPKNAAGKDPRSVMISAPKRTKTTKLKRGKARALVFSSVVNDEDWAAVAKWGRVKLTTIKSGYVKGKVYAYLDDGNYINGSFKAQICEYGEME